ncbi:MAG: hypothetical protein ABSC57_04900 [Syntrophales bacterium]
MNRCTKAIDWEYEKEWRFVNEEGDIEDTLPDVEISSLIFGLDMPDNHKEDIRKATSGSAKIRYRQAVKVPKRFELRVEDV